MQAVKLVISGAFNAGKSQFIAAASEIEPVRTERRVNDHTAAVKPLTTAAMDYGRLSVQPDAVLHLYGTPGQRRFDFMWQALARGMRGLLLVVDSAAPATFTEARSILDFFQQLSPVPFLVAANKQDQPGALSPNALATMLDLPAELVAPCVATEPERARAALLKLLARVPLAAPNTESQAATPIGPRSPAPLAAVTWPGARQHLTQGGGVSLCGRLLPPGALPLFVAGKGGCQVCARAATRSGLVCADCGRSLTRSRDGVRCLGCAERRRTAPRDAVAGGVQL